MNLIFFAVFASVAVQILQNRSIYLWESSTKKGLRKSRKPSSLLTKSTLYLFGSAFVAAWLGFEPRQSESESLVLTITLSGKILVRAVGLEPTRHKHTPLKRACLPIPACSHICFLIKTPQKSWPIYYTCQVVFCQDFFSNFLKFFLKSGQA